MATESLIYLVYSRPEIWDQSNKNYSSKDLKLKAWNYISEKMNLSVNQAKVRWTNLRDLFRRELKKTLKMAKISGNPETYVPRWKHFRSLLFLKDQMIKADDVELPCLTFDDSITKHYPQTIMEDEDSKGDMEYFLDYPHASTNNVDALPASGYKRLSENSNNEDRHSQDHSDRLSKRQHVDESNFMNGSEDYSSFISNTYNETDEDYHFVMSVLPSIRRIRQDRKTSFKMKILQLIMEEEKFVHA